MNDPKLRPLKEADWPEMIRLRAERSTHAGASVSTFTTNPLNLIHTKYLKEPNLVVGAFDELDRLRSFICAYCDPYEEFWVLDLMISDNELKSLHMCLDYCLEHYEAKDIFTFHYAFPLKWERAYRSFWRDSVPRLQKYTQTPREQSVVIDAYKVPTDPWIMEHILHNVLVPVPLLLKTSKVQS